MTTEKKEADQAWQKAAQEYWDIDLSDDTPKEYEDSVKDSFVRGINDYKAALRAEIEKEIGRMPEAMFHKEVSGLRRAIELLDTVTPKEK